MPKFDFSPWAKVNLYDLVARDTGLKRDVVKGLLYTGGPLPPDLTEMRQRCRGAARVYTQDADLYHMGPSRLANYYGGRLQSRHPKKPS